MIFYKSRDLESFAEKGLSEKRQQLRFEHYEEKRLLKLRAIHNVLLKCQAKDANGDAMQVQALLEDLKRQKGTRSNSQYSPFKSQKFYNSNHDLDQANYEKSEYLDQQANKQMDRVISKIDKWNRIKNLAERKKQDYEQRAKSILQQEKQKFDKIEKNQKQKMEELYELIEYKRQKWQIKVAQKQQQEKQDEQKKLLKVKEQINQQLEYFEQKQRKEKSFFEKISRPEIEQAYLGHVSSGGLRSTRKFNASASDTDDGQKVELELKKLEEKLKRAEERQSKKKELIISRGLNHSMLVQERKTMAEQKQLKKFEELFSKTVNKQMRTKSKHDTRMEEINRAALRLQEVHKQKEEKVKRQQEEERRNLQKQLKYLEHKQQSKEAILKAKRDQLMEQIEGKKEKRRLQFEDKAENEKRLRSIQKVLKQQIHEKHMEKEKRIAEMRQQWMNQTQMEMSVTKF